MLIAEFLKIIKTLLCYQTLKKVMIDKDNDIVSKFYKILFDRTQNPFFPNIYVNLIFIKKFFLVSDIQFLTQMY